MSAGSMLTFKIIYIFPLSPQKPLEVREASVKPTKVCVLGLWASQEAEGRRLVELAEALESGRWVGNTSPQPLLSFLMAFTH